MSAQENIAAPSSPGAAPTPVAGKGKVAPEDRYYYASQRELIWWRFTRHKVAVGATVLLILLYLGASFADFVSPLHEGHTLRRYAVDRRLPRST